MTVRPSVGLTQEETRILLCNSQSTAYHLDTSTKSWCWHVVPLEITQVKWARLFQPHFFQWMRGSRIKLKDLKQG